MKKIPISIENFKEIIDENYYFVDKSEFIQDVINEKFSLYTRPRRFGKTLNMSMLYYFFSNKEKDNAYLFDSLKISKNKVAMEYQSQYPVIFMTLKDLKNNTFEKQLSMYDELIQNIIGKNKELFESQNLDEKEKNKLIKYYYGTRDEIELQNALMFIIHCLKQHYHKKVIVLIDEYDVPLQCAYENGYYDEMVMFLRNVFSSALKTNNSLEKGILTGCLRIAKESIFTGLNNFKTYSILDIKSSQYFGFTEEEIVQLLNDYRMSRYIDEVKEWYDGYLFGETEIYNPWSTLMYVERKLQKESLEPISFWANTSGNDVVVNYISEGDQTLHNEFELLMQGKVITKQIKPELTYRDMDDIGNIYSFLLMTGYLKIHKEIIPNEQYELVIPNKEVYKIYNQSFMDYFDKLKSENKDDLMRAFINEDEEGAEKIITSLLEKSISYHDEKEMFYHGFLLGILGTHNVESNRESGDGRLDIVVYPSGVRDKAIVIECKHSSDVKTLIKDSQEAVNQIKKNHYLEGIQAKGYQNVIGYGIAFFKKKCYITLVK